MASAVRAGAVPEEAATTFRSELAWREFHADVLFHHPGAARRSLRTVVPEDAWASGPTEDALLTAWREGRTGYPMVDAGMRQLLGTGWMHNRVRMIVASFLVKDLHVRWQRGAEHFMAHLVDGDVSQNQLNWQWVAGTGRDAAPYFRIFNPVTQGQKLDPDGAYVREWVPELRDIPAGPCTNRGSSPGPQSGIPSGSWTTPSSARCRSRTSSEAGDEPEMSERA
ncbi:FAD-binding domain-containing protein [Oerskovia sp. M15]